MARPGKAGWDRLGTVGHGLVGHGIARQAGQRAARIVWARTGKAWQAWRGSAG